MKSVVDHRAAILKILKAEYPGVVSISELLARTVKLGGSETAFWLALTDLNDSNSIRHVAAPDGNPEKSVVSAVSGE